jgi:hypothetical protein
MAIIMWYQCVSSYPYGTGVPTQNTQVQIPSWTPPSTPTSKARQKRNPTELELLEQEFLEAGRSVIDKK